jgi:UDP-glucose 4-epimerase
MGSAGAVDSNRNPDSNLDELRAHLSVYRACAMQSNSPVVLFCSSRLVFGAPKYLPVDERHDLAPTSIYAAHKITSEKYLEVFARTKGLRSCVFRLSNPYGPHQAEESKGYGIINQFLRNAARGEAIRIYGDGHQVRDYVHVEDVMGALLRCAMETKCHGEIFNFGGRAPMSLCDAAELITRLSETSRVIYEPWPSDYKAVETGDYETDFGKIDSYLNLPLQRSMEEGFREVLQAYRAESTEPVQKEVAELRAASRAAGGQDK